MALQRTEIMSRGELSESSNNYVIASKIAITCWKTIIPNFT